MIPTMIVPILVRPELLAEMISTIDYPVAHLIIIDNGQCVAKLPANKQIKRKSVIRMPSNLGVAGSWNLGIKASPFSPWWLVVNFDITWPNNALKSFADKATESSIVLADTAAQWSAFALGSDVVAQVGLFDESLYPAYFEDLDYLDRARLQNIDILHQAVPVNHKNSSTITSGFTKQNQRTYSNNHQYYQAKRNSHDFTEGRWNITRRKQNDWHI